MRRWTALALLLCCPLSATAQNYNPASSCALISAGFIEEFGDDTQYSQGPLLDQGFTDILLLKDYQPAYDPVVSVGNIVSAIEDGVGVWHNSSHGVTHWMAMETRPADSLGYQYTVAAMADYRGPGGLFEYQAAEIAYYLDPWSGYYYFEVSGSALGSFAVDVGTYFHNASCCSFSYVHELPFQSVASYTAEVLNSDAISDLEWIFQGLNGERGFDNRSLGEAANGSSHLFTLSFEQDYSLTPAVKEFSPPDGVQLPGAGPFPGYVEFDSRLSALGDPAEILLGLGGVRVQGCVWSAPNRIDFEILPYVSGQATLGVYPTRATAELCPQLHLDGNQNPSGSNGRGPAGDWFKWQLQVDHADPNLAVVFEGAWAFPSESGGTRVAWISDTERDALRFEVYGGSERRQLLTTLPAAGAADRPHYYETEVGGRWDHVEVVEVDRGQQRLCASRPFAPRAGPPAEIEAS